MAFVAGAAFLTRYYFILNYSVVSGDWLVYSQVAGNILHGCGVAIISPITGKCVANFGGNQLPLYPAFVAGIWHFVGQSVFAVRVAQACFGVAATLWLTYAIFRLTGNYTATIVAGIILAVSPVQAYWAARLLTETLPWRAPSGCSRNCC